MWIFVLGLLLLVSTVKAAATETPVVYVYWSGVSPSGGDLGSRAQTTAQCESASSTVYLKGATCTSDTTFPILAYNGDNFGNGSIPGNSRMALPPSASVYGINMSSPVFQRTYLGTWRALITGSAALKAPLGVPGAGVVPGGTTRVWGGLANDGTRQTDGCLDWTSTGLLLLGAYISTSETNSWLFAGDLQCDHELSYLCACVHFENSYQQGSAETSAAISFVLAGVLSAGVGSVLVYAVV